jgi:hypothetical protein
LGTVEDTCAASASRQASSIKRGGVEQALLRLLLLAALKNAFLVVKKFHAGAMTDDAAGSLEQ